MSPLAIGAIVLACVFGGALFGMFLGKILPADQLSGNAGDVIKVATAMVVTLAALVLGLLTAAAVNSLSDKENELRSVSAQIVLLDRTLAQYGPETQEARDLLKKHVAERISAIWPREGDEIALEAAGHNSGLEAVRKKLFELSPSNEPERWLQSTALQVSLDVSTSRWLLIQQTGSRIHWSWVTVVVFWLTIVFMSFGLLAPRNSTVTAALFLSALSVAGSIYLILAMDRPYSGPMKIASTPLRMALEQLGRP